MEPGNGAFVLLGGIEPQLRAVVEDDDDRERRPRVVVAADLAVGQREDQPAGAGWERRDTGPCYSASDT
jgi:hypothetical protein